MISGIDFPSLVGKKLNRVMESLRSQSSSEMRIGREWVAQLGLPCPLQTWEAFWGFWESSDELSRVLCGVR